MLHGAVSGGDGAGGQTTEANAVRQGLDRFASRCGLLGCRIRSGAGAGGLGHGRAPFGGDRCGENREDVAGVGVWWPWSKSRVAAERGTSAVVARRWLRSPPGFRVAEVITQARAAAGGRPGRWPRQRASVNARQWP
jgi:hypothetical protein